MLTIKPEPHCCRCAECWEDRVLCGPPRGPHGQIMKATQKWHMLRSMLRFLPCFWGCWRRGGLRDPRRAFLYSLIIFSFHCLYCGVAFSRGMAELYRAETLSVWWRYSQAGTSLGASQGLKVNVLNSTSHSTPVMHISPGETYPRKSGISNPLPRLQKVRFLINMTDKESACWKKPVCEARKAYNLVTQSVTLSILNFVTFLML